jgi:hypothetical protein
VCCLNEAVPTDNTRTELVRRPYTQVWRSELARAVVDEGACRVLFAGLAAVQNSAFLAPAIAEALGVFDDMALDVAETRADCVRGSAFALVYTLVPLAAATALKGDHA